MLCYFLRSLPDRRSDLHASPAVLWALAEKLQNVTVECWTPGPGALGSCSSPTILGPEQAWRRNAAI